MEKETTKISVSSEVDEKLDSMVKRCNDGFSGGKITKGELSNWIIGYFYESCFEKCLEEVRRDHFDELVYLESVVREARDARRNGEKTPWLTSLVSVLSHPHPKRRTNKKNDPPSSDAPQIENGEAQ